MTKCNLPEVVVTGVGVTASIGQGKEDFASSLLSGRHAFDVMKRSGRQKTAGLSELKSRHCLIPIGFLKNIAESIIFQPRCIGNSHGGLGGG